MNATWMTKLRWIVAAGLVGLFFVVGSPLGIEGMLYPRPVAHTGIPTEDVLEPTPEVVIDAYTYIPILLRKPQAASYVSVSGSDAYPGTLEAPWRTLQHAADTAPSGAIIYVRGGTYPGFTLERPSLTFSGYPGESVVVVGDGIEVSTIKVHNTSGVVIRSLTIQDNPVRYGTGIHVEDSSLVTISGNLFQDNQGFGVVLKNVSQVIVEENEFRYNANAIEVRYGSDEVLIQNNLIHHNYRDVDSGRSAIGVNFYYSSGPVIARRNSLWENHTIDQPDPGGAAFEVYAASNLTITENVIWDNETALETGSDDLRTACNNITFSRNTVYRGARQQGLILRCASNSLVAHNTFSALDNFVYDISHNRGEYGASIEGLRILNNINVYGRVYVIENVLPVSVEIDHNLLYNPSSDSQYGDYLAYVDGFGNTTSFAEFRAWTGYETGGLNVNPLFSGYAQRDFTLTSESPAIDAGVVLFDPYYGLAPDLGRFEYVP